MLLEISEGERQRCSMLGYRAGNVIIANFYPLQSSNHRAFPIDYAERTEALAEAILSFPQDSHWN